MIKIAALASALALSMTTSGFAQTTGPSGQQDTNKPSAANSQMNSGSSTTRSGSMGNPNATSSPTPGSTMGPSGQTPKADSK